jgi:hypothetical protein
MSYDQNLTFLTEKIATLKTAILNDLNSFSEHYIYPCLIRAERVDKSGQLWFIMDGARCQAAHFEKPVPVRLQFFADGKNCRLDVTGMAMLPADKEVQGKVADQSMLTPTDSHFLVKVKIMFAEYADVKTPQTSTNVFSMLYYKWLNRTTQMLVL